MEHQLLPRGAGHGEEYLVPYIGKIDYLNISFLEYPKSAGYTFLHEDRSKFWIDYMQLAKESPSPEFLQTWLFCGLLQEMLGRSLEKFLGTSLYNHADFIRYSEGPALSPRQQNEAHETESCFSGQNIVTTVKLNELLEQWSQMVRPKLDSAEPLFTNLLTCIVSVAGQTLQFIGPQLDRQLIQCLCPTMELLGLMLEKVFSKQSYAQNFNYIPPLAELVWTNERVEHMRSRGWCPFQANGLIKSYQFLQCLLYMEKLEKPRPPSPIDRHQDCNVSECRGLLAPDEPQHRYPYCQCDEVKFKSTDWAGLTQIVNSHKVPVLCLNDRNGMIEMEVAVSNPNTKYIALSHVWADGLNNKKRNSLKRCQMDHIYNRLRSLQDAMGNHSSSVYVWIDTICCPLEPQLQSKALALMVETYQNAAAVLVLDSELEMTDCTLLDYLEILTRIACSTWMRRMWTFQEAFLAHTLWVQFRTEALNLDRIMKEHNKIGSRVQAMMLHKFVRSKILGIRRSRIPKPLNRTQMVHIVGKGIQDRFISVPSDEPLCLSTLFDLDLPKVAGKSPGRRMQEFWRLLSESTIQVPSHVIFSGSPRLPAAGYRWAPSTIIDADTPMLLSALSGAGQLCAEGLKVKLPGVLLSPIEPAISRPKTSFNALRDRPTFFRDKTGIWYAFSVEDEYAAHETARKTKSPLVEVLIRMQSTMKQCLPENYSHYAIIGSKPSNGVLTGSSRALLVSILQKKNGVIFVNRIHCVGVPCLINPSLSTILEAAFRYTTEVEPEAEEHSADPQTGVGASNKIGKDILETNPWLHEHLRGFDDSPAYLQRLVELIRMGRHVAQGEVLNSTQQWCVD